MFQHLVTLCIVLVSFVIGYQTDHSEQIWMSVITWISLIVFLVEAIVKIGAQAIVPGTTASKALKKYFNDHW